MNIPSARVLNAYAFTKCSALEYLDLPLVTTIGGNCFSKTGLKTLILRASKVASLAGVSALNETPIANGTGYIYVPSSLLANYKVATNWKTYANQFRAIEDYPNICGG